MKDNRCQEMCRKTFTNCGSVRTSETVLANYTIIATSDIIV